MIDTPAQPVASGFPARVTAAPVVTQTSSPSITREIIASPSRHVQLALVLAPGPTHIITTESYLRISLNIGPSYTIDVTGPQGRQIFECRRNSLLIIPPDVSVTHHAGRPKPAGRAYVPVKLATFRISRELLDDCAMGLGLPAVRCTSAEEFEKAFAGAMGQRGPMFIEAVI